MTAHGSQHERARPISLAQTRTMVQNVALCMRQIVFYDGAIWACMGRGVPWRGNTQKPVKSASVLGLQFEGTRPDRTCYMQLKAKEEVAQAGFARFGAMGRPNGHWAKKPILVCGCLLTPFFGQIGAAAPLREVLATCHNGQIKHTHAQAGHRPTNHAMKAPFLGGGAALAHLLVGRYLGSQLDPPKSPSSKSRNPGLLAAAHARTLLQILLRSGPGRTF